MRQARESALALRGDPVAAPLAEYLEHHVEEELDHDEWLLGDLELIGVDRADVLARAPSPGVAALVGSLYYWVLHYHPVAVLGYAAVLEGYPPSPALIDGMEQRTTYDRQAFHTLIAHSELDPGHSEELFELVDRLPLSRAQAGVIGLSAITTVERLTGVFEELAADFD
jgi:pyrroloquinoline quinone (PQQ) biosynthesis protein C